MTSVIILAAGGSSRMGRPKALLELDDGRSLLEAHLQSYTDAVEELFVAGGAELERFRPACRNSGAVLLHNPQWDSTMPIDTLRLGVSQVRGSRCLVAPVDTVPVSAEDLSSLLACEGAAVLSYRQAPGHPVLLGPDELVRLRAETWRGTLRDLLQDARKVPSQRASICLNMNRPEDWNHWRSAGFV